MLGDACRARVHYCCLQDSDPEPAAEASSPTGVKRKHDESDVEVPYHQYRLVDA